MVESLRDSMKLQLSLELQSISNLFTIHYYLLLQKMVGQNGLALLRQSQVGCNSPLDCCQEPPFESILAPSALRCSVLWGSVSFFRFCRNWWAKMDSNHRPHDYQSCALASWAIGPFWWRLAGSNRWPPACKAGALPAELNPQIFSHLLTRYFFSVPSKLNNVNPL